MQLHEIYVVINTPCIDISFQKITSPSLTSLPISWGDSDHLSSPDAEHAAEDVSGTTEGPVEGGDEPTTAVAGSESTPAGNTVDAATLGHEEDVSTAVTPSPKRNFAIKHVCKSVMKKTW